MNQLDQTNTTRGFMKETYADNRLDKSSELNDRMTINEASRDEYANTIHTLGGARSDG